MVNPDLKKTVIFEFGFLAIFVALFIWKREISNAAMVMYTDNDAVKDAMISCQTTNSNAKAILNACSKLEYELGLNPWMSRVPTESNIADPPSRGAFQKLLDDGCSRTDLDANFIWKAMLDLSQSRQCLWS
eukprot:Skav206251  [mRNA]  locus=scaffold1425:278987:279379:- [translate_table: standard]